MTLYGTIPEHFDMQRPLSQKLRDALWERELWPYNVAYREERWKLQQKKLQEGECRGCFFLALRTRFENCLFFPFQILGEAVCGCSSCSFSMLSWTALPFFACRDARDEEGCKRTKRVARGAAAAARLGEHCLTDAACELIIYPYKVFCPESLTACDGHKGNLDILRMQNREMEKIEEMLVDIS